MRLLFITQDFPPGIGGIQTYSAEHASRLSEWCDDFLLICPDHKKSELDDSLYSFDIERIPVRNHLLFVPLIRRLPELLKKRSFDATYHSQWQTVGPALAAKRKGLIKKVFVAAHARELLYNPYRHIPFLGRFYEKKRASLLRNADHFFPVSEFTAGLLTDQGVAPENITVIVNGTDPELFRPADSSVLKRELGLEKKQIIMTVTRLVRRKGIDTVLEAVASLITEFPDIRYLILGTGPEEKRLKELAENLGIGDHVLFLGRIDYRALPEYYNLSDLFVLSSRTELPDVEGFGIVFLEANACGKPVIGTNSGGVPSAIRNGVTGLIVRENNPVEMARSIRSILNDPEKAAEMGKNGRKRILEETNWEVLSKDLFNQLNIQLAGKKRVLMISPYFLPRRRVGSLRPFKFAAYLNEHGWEPHVLTIKSDGELTDLEKTMMQNVSVWEIDPKLDLTVRSGSQLNMGHRQSGHQEKASVTGAVRSIGRGVADMIDKHFPLDTWLLLFFRELRNIRKAARSVNADIIWSTGDPWSSHWLANKLSRELELPWIADFRDPWTLGGVSLRTRSAFSESVDRRFEQTVIENADFLTFTSERTRELYQNHYPEIRDRSATITNSFDRSLIRKPDLSKEFEFNDKYLNLVFFGKFRGLSPASPVVNLLNDVRSYDPAALDRIRVYSFGSLEKDDLELAGSMGMLDHFIIESPVHPEAGHSLLSAADILLLSTDPRRENIIPAKLWDYLEVGGPVLSIAPNPEIGHILEETGAGVQYPPSDSERCARFLTACVHAKMSGEALPVAGSLNQDRISKYDSRHTTGQLVGILNQLMESN